VAMAGWVHTFWEHKPKNHVSMQSELDRMLRVVQLTDSTITKPTQEMCVKALLNSMKSCRE